MRVIAIGNQKGGVAKTTTARETGALLAEAGARVLLVDLDGQHDLSNFFLDGPASLSVSDVIAGRAKASDAILGTGRERLDLLPATDAAYSLDGDISADAGDFGRVLREVSGRYDFVVMDFPRMASRATVSALAASDAVVIPTEAERNSANSTAAMLDLVDQVRESVNPSLRVAGVLVTRNQARTAISRQYVGAIGEIAEAHGAALFSSAIPLGVAVSEADGCGLTLGECRPGSKPATAYKDYVLELLARLSMSE